MEENDRLNLLEFAYRATKAWLDWTQILLGLSAATFAYLALFLLILAFVLHVRLMRGQTASPRIHVTYFLLHAFIVLFCVAFCGAFSVLYSQGIDLIKLKIIYSAPVLHLVIVAILTVVVGFLAQRIIASLLNKTEDRNPGTWSSALLGKEMWFAVRVVTFCFGVTTSKSVFIQVSMPPCC